MELIEDRHKRLTEEIKNNIYERINKEKLTYSRSLDRFLIKQKEISNLIENIKKVNIGGINGLTIKNQIDKRLQTYYFEAKINQLKL